MTGGRRPTVGTESGLGLIELMVAMMLFLVVMAGVAGTLTAGLKSTMHNRLQTIAKSRAQEQIEEMRSRVFFVPFSADRNTGTETDIDLLDDYFPNLFTGPVVSASGWSGWYDAGDSTYTMISPPDPDTGIVLTVECRFVDTGVLTVTPAATYDSNLEGDDTPPSTLLAVMVRADWSEGSESESYRLDSLISATGQTVQGAGDAGGEQGCTSNSSSEVRAAGARFRISTGTEGAYTPFIEGGAGRAVSDIYSGCETGASAQVDGSEVAQFDPVSQGFVPFVSGAEASATAPMGPESSGPFSEGPTAGWPTASILGSRAQAVAEASEQTVAGEGQSALENMTVSLAQVEGWTDEPVSGYRRWDFLNPVIAVAGGSDPEEGDPDYRDEQAIAALEQLGGLTTGRGKVYIRQIDILPLEARTAGTPSALQGLIFIRDFRAEVVSEAGGIGGAAANSVKTYSATIGMFNATSAPGCVGDECYDLHATAGPENPIQTAIDLSASGYRLQDALLTEFHSHTVQEMETAASASDDGTSASVSLSGGSMWLGAMFGSEVRWKLENPHQDEITLVNQQGAAWVWLGEMSTSLHQE